MQYLVTYAKILTEKDNISLQGVYLGGVSDVKEDAGNIARECTNTIRGGTILPKIVTIEEDGKLLDAMFDACERFEKIVQYMVESNETIKKAIKRKH